MALSERKRRCFVVMPFGEKKDLDGQDIDFDDIYRFFFKKAIEDMGIQCVRCDEIEESGSIHQKMFEQIYQADIVVVDITTSNANVYYELGVRHALAKGVTLLIRRKGTTIPFNIQGMQVVEYDQSRFASIEQAKARIRDIIRNGLSLRRNDSPVHAVLDLNIEPEGNPIGETETLEWCIRGREKARIGLITGDIQEVKTIDVWVNPENTSMQMARPFENSVSGIIRYLGAKKDPANGQIMEDTIAEALGKAMGKNTAVGPADVLVTESGAMGETHKVRLIYHVAANYGQVGQGYIPIEQVSRCITNALNIPLGELERSLENPENDKEGGQEKQHSILFPLMATRSRRGSLLEDRIRPLLGAAIEWLARNENGRFNRVYFLTYTDKEKLVCEELLATDPRLKPAENKRLNVSDVEPEPQVSKGPATG